MKKEAFFLNKLKISFTLSVLFFIISMIPFALANKEKVTLVFINKMLMLKIKF